MLTRSLTFKDVEVMHVDCVHGTHCRLANLMQESGHKLFYQKINLLPLVSTSLGKLLSCHSLTVMWCMRLP